MDPSLSLYALVHRLFLQVQCANENLDRIATALERVPNLAEFGRSVESERLTIPKEAGSEL